MKNIRCRLVLYCAGFGVVGALLECFVGKYRSQTLQSDLTVELFTLGVRERHVGGHFSGRQSDADQVSSHR